MTDPYERRRTANPPTARMLARGRKWADKWARWPAHTDTERQQDFEATEAAREARDVWNGGNR